MTRRQWLFIATLGTLFVLIVGVTQWWKYSSFGYNGLDLGIYSQAVWSLAHGHGFASSIHDPSYLGDHLEPWLVPISWLYRLWSSPLLLLWLQTLIIASAIIPLVKISHRLLGHRAALISTTLFILHPLIYNVALYEFHALVVVLPVLLWSIWWYLEHRRLAWVVSLLALVIAREDMPLVVAGWAVMAALDRRTWRWWLPPIVLAGAWFPIAQEIIRAANHDGIYKYLAFYGWLGSSFSEMALFPFRHPWLFLRHSITLNNLGTVVGMVVTFGFLPFLRPRRLWPLVFLFAQLLIGNAQPGSFLRIHYTLPFLPFLLWAALEAYRDIRSGTIRYPRLSKEITILVATILVILGPLYSSLIVGAIEWPWVGTKREPSTPALVLKQTLGDVQPTDRVATSFSFLPYFANRPNLYSLNYLYLGRRQYSEIPYHLPTDIDVAVIDWQQLYEFQFLYRTTVFEGRSGPQRIQDLLDQQSLGVVARYGSVFVYRRGGVNDQRVMPTNTNVAEASSRLGPLRTLGPARVGVIQDSRFGWREVEVEQSWRAETTKQDELVSIRYSLQQGKKTIWQQASIIGQGPTPVSEWQPGTFWTTRDTLVLSDTLHGTAKLSAEVFIPSGRYRLNRLRTFRPIIDSEKKLGTIQLGEIGL